MANKSLTIEYLLIEGLNPDPHNPHQHSDWQIKQIAQSIKTFGFNCPIVVDSCNQILAGHGRFLAAKRLGWSKIPAIRLTHLTEAQACAFTIADNRLTENARWNERLLGEIFSDLSAQELDFNLEITGFSTTEIDLRIEALVETPEADDAADAPITVATGPAVSRTGDLWQCHRHRVFCGDALARPSFALLLQGELAAMSFVDPPYNVKIGGHVSGLGRIRHREFAMAAGEMTRTEFTGFLTIATKHLAQSSVDGSLHFVCMDWRHAGEMLAAGESSFSELKNICVWTKHNAGMGSFYRSQHEFVFVYKAGSGSHRNNIELGRYGRHRSNVWNYPGVNSFGLATDEGHLLTLHPTVKPVRLIADAILDCTARGDIVLDPFLGSGSTVIAAERMGRCCYGIEIDPLYVDTVIRRWQAYSGERAVHMTSKRTFDELAEESADHG